MVGGHYLRYDRGLRIVTELSDTVKRALDYPFAAPAHSFVQLGERTLDSTEIEVDTRGRPPLLAYAANAAPEVLARKLGESTRDAPVLAVRASLADFDVVYSAHISRYGSVPASLQRSPGTEVTVFVLYLTGEQLRLISATEPNYERATLRDVSCRLESGERLTELAAYISRHGCLPIEGSEVALTAIEAEGRRFPSMTQRQVLEHVRDVLCPGEELSRFIGDWRSKPIPLDAGLREPRTKQDGDDTVPA